MTDKRRDSKGRLLRRGESQRSNGQYMFRYIDADGNRKTVYSWKLVETDRIPADKRCQEALRTIEGRVLRDSEDGIRSCQADKMSVNDMFDTFLCVRTDLKDTTRSNYIFLYDKHVRYSIGRKKLNDVRNSDIFKFYMDLHENSELSVSSIQSINAIVWQLFEMAMRDDIIRRNPSEGVMKKVTKRLNEAPKERHALTVDQQALLIRYVYGNNRYKPYAPLFTTLLGTGMRIGETLGLTWDDIDFKNNVIHVTHMLTYKPSGSGKYEYHISDPKTKAGIRNIPMFDDVRKVMLSAKRTRKQKDRINFTVDGYTGFIFLNRVGKVYTPGFIFDTIQNIVKDYNRDEMMKSSRENREPEYMPKISAHIFRHTFCTRLCENEQNIKIIQDVMGHKTIRTTMEVYSEATAQIKQSSFKHLDGKICIA